MIDVSIGQYYEGSSPVHKTDPRSKFISAILFIAVIFMAKNVFSFALLLVFTGILTALTKIPLRIIAKGFKPIIIIIAFTALMNIFWTKGETPLFDFWIIHIYAEGLWNAGFMIVRIMILLVGTSVILTYTTTPIALTDGLEQLLDPLKKIKVPVHEFSMMMTIALRFIPTLVEETEKIMNAQKARGADFSTGSLIQRARALIPILIPLFISSFRRADELATAMECRGYRGGAGRTRMNVLRFKPSDAMLPAATVLMGAAVVLINMYAPGYSLTW